MERKQPVRDASDVRWAPAGRGEVQHVALEPLEQRAQRRSLLKRIDEPAAAGFLLSPLVTYRDELRAMLRARQRALRDLAPNLPHPGANHPRRNAVAKQRRAARARLRALVASLDATIAAFIDEHQQEILG